MPVLAGGRYEIRRLIAEGEDLRGLEAKDQFTFRCMGIEPFDGLIESPLGLTQQALADLDAARFDPLRQADTQASTLQKLYRGDADLRLLVFGKEIVEQQDFALISVDPRRLVLPVSLAQGLVRDGWDPALLMDAEHAFEPAMIDQGRCGVRDEGRDAVETPELAEHTRA